MSREYSGMEKAVGGLCLLLLSLTFSFVLALHARVNDIAITLAAVVQKIGGVTR